MSLPTTLRRRASAIASAAALVVLSAAPVLLNSMSASAAQLTQRQITMSTSTVSATGASYAVSFKTTQATTVKGIVVEFCSDSPLIGLACTHPAGMAFTVTGSYTVSNTAGTPASTSFAASGSSGATFVLTDNTGFAPSTANPVTFTITGVTNPSALGTFYARILTYNTTAGATGYSSTTPGTHLDDGGVALSTANQLTTNARVQEQLSFCIGTTAVDDDTTQVATDCSGVSGTTVDIGPIGTSTSVSPVTVANGGNGLNGVAMVQTNAFNGVAVSYFAEQAGTGTNHLGALRVTGATCAAGTSNTDQCFNSHGTTQGTFAASSEDFGMTVGAVNCGSVTAYTCTFTTGNYNLARDAEYDGNGTDTVGTSQGFAWDETGTADFIASSAGSATKVVDNEALILKFAAQANITTPTGSYGVTSTYIATATF